MSTNIGLYGTTNFTKAKTIEYATGTQTINDPNDIDPDMVAREVLKTIGSLNKHQDEVNLETDKNPLDNIIRNEVIDLFNYRKLSKSKINNALDQIGLGQDPSPMFTVEEATILLTQARKLEYISESEYLGMSGTPQTFWFRFQEEYLKTLNFQLSLPATIPTIDELKVAGMVEFILTTIRENPESVIDENLIKQYTEQHIDDILLSSEFIGYEKAQKIYADPTFIMNILDKSTLKYFLYRVKPYLNFITDDKIDTIMEWVPSQYPTIGNIFTPTQIRLMIDKELDIKNLILKTLTLEEVQRNFNELAAQFKIDFTEAFTNEKLMELIQIVVDRMFPPLSTIQIYENLATTFKTTISETKITSIEDYLTKY